MEGKDGDGDLNVTKALEVFKVLEREDPDIDIANIMHCKGNVYNIR